MLFATRLSQLIRKWNNKRLQASRSLKLSLFRILFDHLRLSKNSTPHLKEILILRLDGKLGDSITSTGFLKTLSDQFSDHKISIVTSPELAQFFSAFSFLNVLTLKKGFLNSILFYFSQKSHVYSVVVNTSHIMSPRTLFLISNLKAKKKVSSNCSDFKLFSDHALFNPWTDHITKRYQSLLKVMGSSSLNVDYILPSHSAHEGIAQQDLKSIQGSAYIILNSFSGARRRSFNFETTVKIIKHLNRKFRSHLVVSIGNAGDLRILTDWKKQYLNDSWVLFLNCSSFLSNVELMRHADFVVSPDTAIVHASCALNKKLIAIYRPDLSEEKNSQIWAPYGNSHKVIFSNIPEKFEELDINFLDIEKI